MRCWLAADTLKSLLSESVDWAASQQLCVLEGTSAVVSIPLIRRTLKVADRPLRDLPNEGV